MELGNDYEILRKYGKTITYADTKYQLDEFEELLTDNPEFLQSITNDIVAKIKQSDVPVEEVEVEEDVIEEPIKIQSSGTMTNNMTGSVTATLINNSTTDTTQLREDAIITPTTSEPTTIYEQLRQQALANNDLL